MLPPKVVKKYLREVSGKPVRPKVSQEGAAKMPKNF
jgi:hypothetical protein